MTEAELQAILSRNPQIKASESCGLGASAWIKEYEHKTVREVLPEKSELGKANALDPVVSGKGKSQGRITVRFVLCRARLLDVDAVAGCCKDLLDGLQDACLIPGDRQDDITFEARQKKVGKKDEGVIIDIEYA